MKPEPKFKVGQAVMIRSIAAPELNCDFAVVIDLEYREKWRYAGRTGHAWGYILDRNMHGMHWCESALRPLPPEKGTTWDKCAWQPKEVIA